MSTRRSRFKIGKANTLHSPLPLLERPIAGIRAFALKNPVLALAIWCCVLFIPTIGSLPPLDRDESRYAQATSQMLETGDFIDIRFQEAPRYKKPVGIYWLQALSVSAFSDVETREIWAYRLPSVLGGLLTVLMTYWGLSRLYNQEIGLLAGLLMSGSLVLIVEANIAKTDAMLTACVVISQMCVGLIYTQYKLGSKAAHFISPGPLGLLFWLAMGIGILIKGPIAPLITGLTLVTLCVIEKEILWLKRLSPLAGIPILAVILLPWGSAIWELTDGAFFTKAFTSDLAPKMVGGQESHGAPPLYYTALVMAGFWPSSLFLAPALIWAWQNKATPAIAFLLAWIIPNWILLELTPTKLPHYTLPLYPALAGLMAIALYHIVKQGELVTWLQKRSTRILAGVWGLIAILFASLITYIPSIGFSSYGLALAPISALVIALSGTSLLVLFKYESPTKAIALSLGAALIFTASLKALTIQGSTDLTMSPRMAQAAKQHSTNQSPAVASSGYAEPSLVFLLGTQTKLLPTERAADYLANTPGALAFIEKRKQEQFLEAAASNGTDLEVLETLSGVNYSRGRKIEMTLYRATP